MRFLDPRLAAVAAFVPAGSRVADVGADHGRLALALVRSDHAASCIATEATPARLLRLRARVERSGGDPRLTLRCGDGLEPLSREDRLDVLVLAGLGGPSMVRILADPRRPELRIPRLVLQPATDAGVLRRWLLASGLATMDERLVEVRGRFHVVIAAEAGASLVPSPSPAGLDTDDLLEVGPVLVARRDPHLLPYWRATRDRQRGILRGASPGRGRDEALRLHALAERVLSCLDGGEAGRDGRGW
jgi:tRNA (adenine22-N1)-methyltransferase